jgi:hypothetical protein
MKKYIILIISSIYILLILPGCEAIGSIFKAGVWSGIIIVAVIIFLIIVVIAKANKRD